MDSCMFKNIIDIIFDGKNEETLSPLEIICNSEKITEEILSTYLEYYIDNPFNNYNMHNHEIDEIMLHPNSDDWTPLHYLCNNEKITEKILEILLRYYNKETINIDKDEGRTPLHLLCDNNKISFELLDLMLKNNANINHCGNKIFCYDGTPFHNLCANQNLTLNILKLAMQYVKDINVECYSGNSVPLEYLIINNDDNELISFMLENGAKICRRNMTGLIEKRYKLMLKKKISEKVMSSTNLISNLNNLVADYICEDYICEDLLF